MQPIIHFLMSIVAGLGVGLHLDNKIRKYLLLGALALVTTGIDLDHVLPLYETIGVKIFHNVFVFVVLPVSLLLLFMVLDKKRESTIRQRTMLGLCVMFAGHMFIDSITTGVPLYYPFTSARFTLMEMGMVIDAKVFSLTSWQMIMIFWAVMIIVANLVENMIYKDAEGKGSIEWPIQFSKTGYRKKRYTFTSLLEKLPFASTQPVNGFTAHEEMKHKDVNLGQYDAATDYIFNFVDNLRNH